MPVSSVGPAASSPAPDRAGSRAGEGRQRPGRVGDRADEDASGEGQDTGDEDSAGEDGTGEDPDAPAGDGTDTAAPESPEAAAPVPSTAPRDTVRQAADQGNPSDAPVLRILPLGSGLVLVGLGIALALAALRLRRG
ncbi:hypothetical protein AB0G76_19290 [Streptomyces asoensis]|uniref:hypothetical protein n=1 Tax=Streptomyces asoensis TaxID=249586 RepID=UPI00340CDB9D